MLREIYLENFALVDKLRLELGPGLNVLTGETGAGKSVLIDAVEVALGGRASADYVKAGADRARIELLFDVPEQEGLRTLLADMGYDEGDQLVISREILAQGRSVARINGRPVTVGTVQQLSSYLVDIHGQHEHQWLLKPHMHRRLLDSLGGQRLRDLLDQVGLLYRRHRQLRQQLEAYSGDARTRAREMDLLRFQIREIQAARLQPEEESDLLAQRQRLMHAQRLREVIHEAYATAYAGGPQRSAFDSLGEVCARLEEAAQLDGALGQLAAEAKRLQYELRELSSALRRASEEVNTDPAALEAVEERLEVYRKLKRKYGSTVEEILAYQEEMERRLSRLENSEEEASRLQAELEAVSRELATSCRLLSEERRRAARRLEDMASEQLSELGMARAALLVRITQEEDAQGLEINGKRVRFGPEGIDRVEFLFAPNPGEPPRPLSRIASGGEISRVMLALKYLLARDDDVPTLIFDEVDSGIGGRAGAVVGSKLHRIARDRQVICVTHLAQIACLADHHHLLSKRVRAGRTVTEARSLLKEEEKVRELARMLAGEVSETALEHARQLLRATSPGA